MAEPIRYMVDLGDRLRHLVRVTCTVPADLAAGARLTFSVWTPGSYVRRDYVRHLQWIHAVDAEGAEVTLAREGGGTWLLGGATGPVEVTYELYANDLSVRTNHVDDHHALLIPAATFAYVESGTQRQHVVHLAPQPAGHRVHSLLPAGVEPDTYVAEDRDHLIDSAFEVGDLPSVTFDVAGAPHTFVWAGHTGGPDMDEVAHDAAAIARSCIELFEGHLPVERYTFLAAGWDEGGGGLEHRDGAVLQAPVRTFQDPETRARFLALVAHEYLHLWNVKRLIPAALVRPEYGAPTRSESLWVAEGWTAYYDEVLCVRAGVWKPARLLDTLAAGYHDVTTSHGPLLQSLRRAGYEAWEKHYVRDENAPNAMTDYYTHGSLVAWEIDLRLRAQHADGGGLDDVLRTLWARHAGGDRGYTEDDVLAAVAAVGGEPLAAVVQQRTAQPCRPQLDEVVAAVGLRWGAGDEDAAPSLGVRVRESDAAVVLASVERGGPAWTAGVTGGDRLLAVAGRTIARGGLEPALHTHAPGDVVELTLARGPRLLTLAVTLAEPTPRRRLVPVDEPSPAQRAAFTAWCARSLDDLAG